MKPVATALFFSLWIFGVRDARPVRPTYTPSLTQIVADTDGAFAHLVLHFDPRAEGVVGPTYRDLLRAIDPRVRFSVVVAHAEHFQRFKTLLDRWQVANITRFQPTVVGREITTWSRDRFTLLKRNDGTSVMLQPPRPSAINPSRRNDWLAPRALGRDLGFAEAEAAPLVFDGGDLIATESVVFATALLAQRNAGGELGRRDVLTRWLERKLGRPVLVLGQNAAEVPEHHIGMFVTPLGGKRVLVGDPDLGLSLLPDHAALPGEVARGVGLQPFRNIARALSAAGYQVIRTPLVPLQGSLTYLTYNNAILERRDGQLHAYVPTFGIARLDRVGLQVYRDQGAIVHPIDVAAVYQHNGTVRCLVNVLRRSN